MRTVKNIIKDRAPHTVDANWSVKRVVNALCEHKTGAVVVCEGGEVVGVFSERDLMHRVVQAGHDPEKLLVCDVMSKDIIHVSPDEDYRVAKAYMIDNTIRHLLILDEEGKLKGLISMSDLLEVDLAEYCDLIKTLNDRYYENALRKSKV